MLRAPDEIKFLATSFQFALNSRDVLGGNYQYQTHAEVKCLKHLVPIDIAQLRKITKNRKYWPGSQIDHGFNVFWNRARKVSRDAAAGDVGH